MSAHKVCIIGNSHAAAIHLALKYNPDLQDNIEFDCFLSHGETLRKLNIQGETLVPTTSALKRTLSAFNERNATEIHVREYDAFLLIGLGFGIIGPGFISALASLRKCSIVGFNDVESINKQYISRPFYKAMMQSRLTDSVGIMLASMIKSIAHDVEVHLIPSPLPSEEICKEQQFWNPLIASGTWGYSVERYRDIAQKVVRSINCNVIFQPSITLTKDDFTLAKYSHKSSRLSVGLNIEHPLEEYFHMNGLYGAEILNEYRGHLFLS